MINKLNLTSFKGTIQLRAGNAIRKSGNSTHVLNVIQENIDTDNIIGISQHDRYGYTRITTYHNNYEKDQLQFHYVPTWFTSSSDIIAAYSAAKNSNIYVELENKSNK